MYISEVFFGISNDEIGYYLDKIFDSLNISKLQKGNSKWNLEWRKWRYYILQKKIKNMKNDEGILMKTDEVCADFNYPQDMKSLIYYIPPNKKETHTDPSHARADLVKK